MKKKLFCGLILMVGLSSRAFAGGGDAKDGLVFVLVLAGFMIMVALLFEGVDYFRKNRKILFNRLKFFIKDRLITHFLNHMRFVKNVSVG